MSFPSPHFIPKPLDAALKSWCEHELSLTDKLVAAQGGYQIDVLHQGWVKNNWWNKYYLSLDEPLIFQREMLMRHGAVNYWYARTIIPQTCYSLNPSFFGRLTQESVRALIFNQDEVIRSDFRYYPINEGCLEFYWIKKYLPDLTGQLWLRLARFSFQQTAAFYLMEILLPELGGLK